MNRNENGEVGKYSITQFFIGAHQKRDRCNSNDDDSDDEVFHNSVIDTSTWLRNHNAFIDEEKLRSNQCSSHCLSSVDFEIDDGKFNSVLSLDSDVFRKEFTSTRNADSVSGHSSIVDPSVDYGHICGELWNWESDPEDLTSTDWGQRPMRRTFSDSESSWSSNLSDGFLHDLIAECNTFMNTFVIKIFNSDSEISQQEKARFGQLCLHGAGRKWFTRNVYTQRSCRHVKEMVFYRLVQFFAICLFECDHADDFVPAKTLMILCFTFYHEYRKSEKIFLFQLLKSQPIWHSLRFWNAAFFDSVQHEKMCKELPPEQEGDTLNEDCISSKIIYEQLGAFTCNMVALGLPKSLSVEFLAKQSLIGPLNDEHVKLLREHIEKLA